MSRSNLLISSLLIAVLAAVWVAPSFGQSPLADRAGAIQSQVADKPSEININVNTDQPWFGLKFRSSQGNNPFDRMRIDQYQPPLKPRIPIAGPVHPIERGLLTDTVCYSMRTFRVDRDAPDSDSTHAAGYSTCQPARRFQLKNADEHLIPADR
jgi:hypothetical protein